MIIIKIKIEFADDKEGIEAGVVFGVFVAFAGGQ